jgi:mRNA-degrading endonuclease RelE of RelBE toxin-antitoxin system
MPEKKFQLVPTKTFLKDLKKVDPKLKKKISKVLDSLQANPFQGKKLTAIEIGKWRIRFRDYRIRYDIEANLIILYTIRHRKDIYKH